MFDSNVYHLSPSYGDDNTIILSLSVLKYQQYYPCELTNLSIILQILAFKSLLQPHQYRKMKSIA